jgi:ribosomal protein S15P/S13E
MSEASQQEVSVSEALDTTSVDPSLYETVEAMKSEINALKSHFNKHCIDSSNKRWFNTLKWL